MRDEEKEEQFENEMTNIQEIKEILQNIQAAAESQFRQLGRNIIIRLLKNEGYEKVELITKRVRDSENFVSNNKTEVVIDGFSLDPPLIAEITSILRNKNKVKQFLRKKQFLEKEYDRQFRGFFLIASSELTDEEIAKLTKELSVNNSEFLNFE